MLGWCVYFWIFFTCIYSKWVDDIGKWTNDTRELWGKFHHVFSQICWHKKRKQYCPFRTSFILCCRCFNVKETRELLYKCKKSAKRDKAKIREILAPHLLQRFLAKLSPVVKSEQKISDFVGCFIQATKKTYTYLCSGSCFLATQQRIAITWRLE